MKVGKNMFFIVGKRKKNILVFFLVCLGIIISSIYFLRVENVKADKSNSVQVVKMVEDVSTSNIDFFTEYRLDRDKLRSERSEILRNGIKSATDEENRQALQEKILKMVQEKQQETEMESLIKAKGFADVLIFCSDKSVSAVVKAEELSKDEVIQVADIITRVTNCKVEDITISAKP